MSNTLFKKVTAAAAALSIVLSIVSPVVGVKAADASVDAANRLASLGVIVDNSADPSKYNLGSNITRREMLKVMMNLSSVEVTETCEGKFSDLPASDWGCKYAEAALKAGFIAANAKFRPNDMVTEAEALKMIMQARGVAKAEGVEPWAEAYRQAAVEAGILSADAKVSATAAAKRSMVIVSADSAVTNTTGAEDDDSDVNLDDLFGDLFDEDGEDMSGSGETSTGTTSTGANTSVKAGNLELSLNPTSLASGTQIPGTGTILFAKVDFTAGSSDISLNSVEVKKVWLASVDSNTKVWFEKNGKRISGRAWFTSEWNVVLSFSPSYVVKAWSTDTLDLYVEVASVNGVDFQFTSGEVKSSAGSVSGSFTTPVLRTTNYTVADIDFAKWWTASDYKASSDSVELGAFKLTANDSKAEQTDVIFQTVTLYTTWSSASLTNLTDIKLVRNDVVVSSDVVVDGKTLTFTVADSIKEWATATYYVKANVSNVEDAKDTYQLYLKAKSDLSVIESKNGFRATINDEKVDLNKYTVTGGEVKFERDSSVALSKSYAPGTSEVVLMQGKITAKNSVRLENIVLSYTSKDSSNTVVALSKFFNTVNLVIGGTSFSSSAPTNSYTTSINFDGTVNISGTVDVKLYATLKSSSEKGTVKFDEMKLSSFDTKEFVSNDEEVTSGVGTIAWVTVTVEDSTLNVTRNDGLGSTTLAAGSKAVTLYGLTLSSTKGNPINVTSATIAFTWSNSSTSTGHLNNVYATLYVDGTAVSSKTIDNNSIKFDWFTAKVSSSASVNMVVKADLSDSFASGSIQAKLVSLTAVDTATSDEVLSSAYSKPTGATFTIKAAKAQLASSDSNPKASLFEAGSANNKVLAFKVTAKNDTIKLKDINLSGTWLNALSNFRLTNASNTVVAYSSSASDSLVKFESVASDNTAIAMDKSATYFVIADANSSTNVENVSLQLDSVKFTWSNGSDDTEAQVVSGKVHAIADNVLVIAKASNSSKLISNSALRFTVTASGKDEITLSGVNLRAQLSWYTGATQVEIYKDNLSQLAGTWTFVNNSDKEISLKNYNTVDAGSTVTYIVLVKGAITDSNVNGTPDWNLTLNDVEFEAGSLTLNAVDYYNVATLPITETK